MSACDLPHLAGLIFGAPLMIARPKLDTVLGVLRPRLFGGDLPSSDGQAAEPPPYVVTPTGVAVVPVFGTLVNRCFGLSALSGMTSYQQLAATLAEAEDDPAVLGILLNMDSSGGEAGGVFDLAERVLALRGIKPVYALADQSCFSAAYAIAAGAERVYVTSTGGVGSIGVVALHADQSGADIQAGLNYEYLSAGAHKIDGNPHAPLSDGARASLQGEVDRLYGMFTAHVAKARGLPEAQVRDQQAGLYFGASAVAAGMADQVGTPTSVMADLNVRIGRTSRTSVLIPSPKGTTMTEMSPTGTTLQAAPPATETELRAQLAAELTAQAGGSGPATEDRETLAKRLRAEAAEVLELCQIAGQPALAADFVRQGLAPAAVRKTLLGQHAAGFEANPVFPVSTQAPVGVNPLIAAMRASYPSQKGT